MPAYHGVASAIEPTRRTHKDEQMHRSREIDLDIISII